MKLSSRIVVWFQALVVIGCFSALKAETAPGTYVAAAVKGTVTWVNPTTKAEAPLTSGTKLPAGAVITTGDDSSVVLAFASGATTTLTSNTSIEVSKFAQEAFSPEALLDDSIEPAVSVTEINIIRGQLVGEVRKLRTGSEFNVNSPVGAAGVRGTKFSVSYDAATGNLIVATSSGLVVVLKPDGGSYSVSSDTTVSVTQDGASVGVEAIDAEEKAVIEEIAAAAKAIAVLATNPSTQDGQGIKAKLKAAVEQVQQDNLSDEVSVAQ